MSGDAQVVNDVMAILGTSAEGKRSKIERIILLGRGYARRISKAEMASGRYGVITDKHKRAARKAAMAIHRLQAALHDPNLVRQDSTDDEAESLDITLERLRLSYEADARKLLREKRYRAVAWSKHAAAKTAAEVLQLCGLPLSLRRNGHFVRIAALIYGHEGADLRKVCGTVRRELRSE